MDVVETLDLCVMDVGEKKSASEVVGICIGTPHLSSCCFFS